MLNYLQNFLKVWKMVIFISFIKKILLYSGLVLFGIMLCHLVIVVPLVVLFALVRILVFVTRKEYFMKRHKISKKLSKKIFRKGVNKTKIINVAPKPMRGGFRI